MLGTIFFSAGVLKRSARSSPPHPAAASGPVACQQTTLSLCFRSLLEPTSLKAIFRCKVERCATCGGRKST